MPPCAVRAWGRACPRSSEMRTVLVVSSEINIIRTSVAAVRLARLLRSISIQGVHDAVLLRRRVHQLALMPDNSTAARSSRGLAFLLVVLLVELALTKKNHAHERERQGRGQQRSNETIVWVSNETIVWVCTM